MLYRKMLELTKKSFKINEDGLIKCLQGIEFYQGIDGVFKGKLNVHKLALITRIRKLLGICKDLLLQYNEYIKQFHSQKDFQYKKSYKKCKKFLVSQIFMQVLTIKQITLLFRTLFNLRGRVAIQK